jgi:hypothetical protein
VANEPTESEEVKSGKQQLEQYAEIRGEDGLLERLREGHEPLLQRHGGGWWRRHLWWLGVCVMSSSCEISLVDGGCFA